MKLFKKMRKGFTLIELVVVIAVIAILSAVAVVSYISITNRAKESNDHMVIDQINTSLLSSQILEKKATVHEIVERFDEEEGYDVRTIKPELKNARFVYSYENGKFGYWKDSKVVYPADLAKIDFTENNDLWFFEDEAKATYNDSYSHYLKAAGTVTSITTNGGLDVGSCTTISTINLSRPTAAKKGIVVRTNSAKTDLIIDCDYDTVNHYGLIGNVKIEHVASASYDEYGRVAGVCSIADGHIVVKDGGEMTSIAVVTSTASNVAIDTEGKGTVGITFVANEAAKNQLSTSTNTGINNWFYEEYKDENGNIIDPTNVEAIIEAIEKIANESLCYIKETNTYYDDFRTAFNAMENGQTVILVRDASVEYDGTYLTLANDLSLTFDLNGHKLFATCSTQSGVSTAFITINAGCTLTVKDSTDLRNDGASSGLIENNALHATEGSTEMVTHASVTINNKGTFNLKSGTISNVSTVSNASPDSSYIAQAAFAIDSFAGAVTNISGGCVRNDNGFSHTIRLSCELTKTNTMNISGGYIYNVYRCCIWLQNPSSNNALANLNISGGTIETGNWDGRREPIGVGNNGHPSTGFAVSITGGKFMNNGQDVTNYEKGLDYTTYTNNA